MTFKNDPLIDYLDDLEAEAIYIMREVAGQFERPALLFSGGKDSITLVNLARKAFAPCKIPSHWYMSIPVTTSRKLSHTGITSLRNWALSWWSGTWKIPSRPRT